MINRRFPSLMCKVVSSSKIFLFLFFLFFAGDLSATEVFTTHFNRNDFLIILIPSAFILLIISALNIAIKALELTDEENSDPKNVNLNLNTKFKSKIDELKEVKSVLFYCSLIIFCFYISYCFVSGTPLESYTVEWINLIVRWAHVVFGIAWIGASFYFNFLENSLNRTKGLRDEISGNLWAVHGGGVYYLEKYKAVPSEVPKDLHWFKYEAYFTWLSGFTLLVVVYYLDAKAYLIDTSVLDLSPTAAVLIGIGSLLISWLIYDSLCKSVISQKKLLFGLILFLFITGASWLLTQVFSSRAAYIHVGAIIGTIMVGNVFRVIIPSQKAMVNAAKEGKIVDTALAKKALLRSLHNNYFTLPVIFIMISNHFPSTYGNVLNWFILMGLSLVSVLVKHYLNLIEKGEKAIWILPLAIVGMIGLAILTSPQKKSVCKEGQASNISQVKEIMVKRCIQCHSANPTDENQKIAPNGIMFDDNKNIIKYAQRILVRAVITKTMPQGNKTNMTQEERDLIQCWIENGAKGD